MDPLDYWRLCEELSVKQAALLIADTDPSDAEYVQNWKPEERPIGYDAAVQAIHRGLKRGAIAGELVPMSEHDINGNECGWIEGTIELNRSHVNVESLRDFLAARGFRSGFFATTPKKSTPDYLDPKHPRYAPKLAAAVTAWQEVTDPNGKTPKQALKKWLNEHAAAFNLTKDDGTPNAEGIEQASSVANWRPDGGAPRTPAGNPPTP